MKNKREEVLELLQLNKTLPKRNESNRRKKHPAKWKITIPYFWILASNYITSKNFIMKDQEEEEEERGRTSNGPPPDRPTNFRN